MGKMKLAEEVEFSATSVDFLFSLPASVELEGGVFSEYHCNLYFAEVKQISCSGRIHLLWHPRSTSDSWLTQHPQQLTLLTAPFPPSFLLWEPAPPDSAPHPQAKYSLSAPSHCSLSAGGLWGCLLPLYFLCHSKAGSSSGRQLWWHP